MTSDTTAICTPRPSSHPATLCPLSGRSAAAGLAAPCVVATTGGSTAAWTGTTATSATAVTRSWCGDGGSGADGRVVFGLIGWFLIKAAVEYDPKDEIETLGKSLVAFRDVKLPPR